MRVVGKRQHGEGDRDGLDALVLEFGSLEGLLRMKEHGRLKDQADADAIRQALAKPRG